MKNTDHPEMRPTPLFWTCLGPVVAVSPSGERLPIGSVWSDGLLRVLSSVDVAQLPGGDGLTGPQWHISISKQGMRSSHAETRRALCAFGMLGAEEDNHHPGIARHFWRPIDERYRVDCECKADEATIVEADGYKWTNPVDGPCRGCEATRLLGIPCPIHAEVRP